MGNIAVIGGGPAGMMAAAAAAKNGAKVILIERNEKLGKKLFLTGKGRCNITNTAGQQEFFENVVRNPKFLYSAFANFSNEDMMRLLEQELHLPIKVERGGRVFPASDKSSDVISALTRLLRESGVTVHLNEKVMGLEADAEGLIVRASSGAQRYNQVILATGGMSYPSTGSDGAGFRLAQSLGHTLTALRPALVPLVTRENWSAQLQGLSLKNVTLSVWRGKRCIYSQLGEMLFTHFGVSGPLVLSASSVIADKPEDVRLSIDLKPGLSHEELDRRILRDFEKNNRRFFANALWELLPSKLVPVVVALSQIPEDQPVSSIQREQRRRLVETLKDLSLTVAGTRPLEEAIITRGGVSIREVNSSTMASKLVPGLYFAGEMLDTDAYTGGYNLQIAYSTGWLAGQCASENE